MNFIYLTSKIIKDILIYLVFCSRSECGWSSKKSITISDPPCCSTGHNSDSLSVEL